MTIHAPAPTEDLQALVVALFAAWNTKNPQTLGSAFPADGEFTDVLGHHAEGPDAIADLHAMPFGRLFTHARLACTKVRARLLSSELASVEAMWRMEGHVSPQGEPMPPREGTMHIVAARRGQLWSPLIVHNNDYGTSYQEVRGNGVSDGS